MMISVSDSLKENYFFKLIFPSDFSYNYSETFSGSSHKWLHIRRSFLTCTDSKTLLDERLSYIVKDRTDLRYKLISAVAFDQMTIQKYSAAASVFTL